jgi:hypothetical protein
MAAISGKNFRQLRPIAHAARLGFDPSVSA